MHLLNIRTLVEELAKSELTEPEKMKYLLGTFVLYYCASYFSIYSHSYSGALFYSEFAILLLINISGILYCFKCNGGRSSTHFIENFTCIGLPALVWCYIVFWIPYYVVIYQTKPEWLGLHPENAHKFGAMVNYFTIIGFEIVFFILVATNLKRLKSLQGMNRGMTEAN